MTLSVLLYCLDAIQNYIFLLYCLAEKMVNNQEERSVAKPEIGPGNLDLLTRPVSWNPPRFFL